MIYLNLDVVTLIVVVVVWHVHSQVPTGFESVTLPLITIPAPLYLSLPLRVLVWSTCGTR